MKRKHNTTQLLHCLERRDRESITLFPAMGLWRLAFVMEEDNLEGAMAEGQHYTHFHNFEGR